MLLNNQLLNINQSAALHLTQLVPYPPAFSTYSCTVSHYTVRTGFSRTDFSSFEVFVSLGSSLNIENKLVMCMWNEQGTDDIRTEKITE
jgi:hypothetical protein